MLVVAVEHAKRADLLSSRFFEVELPHRAITIVQEFGMPITQAAHWHTVRQMNMVSERQVEAYEQDGFLSGIWVMTDKKEVQYYRDCFDTLEAKGGREKAQTGLFDRHFDQQFIWEIATHPKILDSVAAIIDPNIRVSQDHTSQADKVDHLFAHYGLRDVREPILQIRISGTSVNQVGALFF